MSRGRRQDRGDGAGIGAGWNDLAEPTAVEGQESIVCGREHQFGLARVSKNGWSQSNQLRSGELAAGGILMKQGAGWVKLQQPRWPGYIKMILKASSLLKDCGRADSLESGI